MANVQLQKEHEWLQRLVGEWTWTSEAAPAPGQAPERYTGSERVRSLDGVWIIGEGRGDLPGGGTAATVITLGYDPAKGRFVGTFLGSMMTHLWLYEGALDETGRVLTLDTEGPSFETEGQIARYQDRFELESDDHRILTSTFLGADGAWHPFMTAHYRRAR